MNKKGTVIGALVMVFVMAAFTSCKKIRQDTFIKGLWKIESIYLDTVAANQLTNLPHYNDGNNCCDYRLDFQDGDVVFGYYLTYDTFNFVTVGKWQLQDYTHITLNLGDYLDGKFEIKKPTPNEFEMTSSKNHVKAFDGINPTLDTCKTVFTMVKQ